tara:strand:+ start:876 stop:1199 length:324 start_codon:yes stop_codon:yes gene_type:complete
MPCYDPRDNENESYVLEIRDNPLDKKLIKDLSEQNKKLEAGLCALLTELEKKGIADEVITQASKSGLINLTDFWLAHSKEDETRLSVELHKFSEHEQNILKRLLNER